jgi:hypothetical protein
MSEREASLPLDQHAVTFSDQQTAQLGEALFDAELALLQAIAKEAARLESFDAVRNIPRLVSALQGLRSCMGQGSQRLWATTVGTNMMGHTPLFRDEDEFLETDD